jgi:hypothetical protein
MTEIQTAGHNVLRRQRLEVLLGTDRNGGEIIHRPDILGTDAVAVKQCAVVGDILISVDD